MRSIQLLLFAVLTLKLPVLAGSHDWTHYGHTPNRISIAVDGPNTIDASVLDWTAWEDPAAPGYYIDYAGQSSPAVYKNKVYANAKYYDEYDIHTHNQIICYDSDTGEDLWHTIVDKHVLDSYSSPCVDDKNNTVIIGSGMKVFAMDADSGQVVWTVQLQRSIVNASVCLALDIVPARAFITDYDGRGNQGRLYCINLDPNEPVSNPYNPGDIVWSDVLGGTSGNSPAYQNGAVYVASITDVNHVWGDPNCGTVHAYDAAAADPRPLWKTTDARFDGFFGGVCVTKEGFLYAANYNFYGGENNSGLCKIDCSDGRVVWVTPAERTKSIPVVVADRIYLSAGLDSYGSRTKLQVFRDLGNTAELVWQTPSSFAVGGWMHQPVYANNKLYIGKPASGGYFFGPCTDFYILDVTLTPQDAGFVLDHYAGCGSSPVVIPDCIFTIGAEFTMGPQAGQLYKFYQPAILSDVNHSGQVDIADLQMLAEDWLFNGAVGIKRTDFNLDGNIDLRDYAGLAQEWLY